MRKVKGNKKRNIKYILKKKNGKGKYGRKPREEL